MQEPPRSYWSSSSHVYSIDGPDIWDESSGVLELILGVKKYRTTLQRGQDRSYNSLGWYNGLVRQDASSYDMSCNYFSSRQSLKISEQHGFFPRPRCDHFVASGSYNKWYNSYNESYNGKNFESQAVVVCLATIVKGA